MIDKVTLKRLVNRDKWMIINMKDYQIKLIVKQLKSKEGQAFQQLNKAKATKVISRKLKEQ